MSSKKKEVPAGEETPVEETPVEEAPAEKSAEELLQEELLQVECVILPWSGKKEEACVELGYLTQAQFDEVFHPEQMV